ncbi:hypothetical protein CCYA_CCYA15G3928 [Cyanidiococcus yangmingshanensis]|nr:hypothetical protein CCYA_CCYA15G3928 [Cyanidiococcus yangmingshanensis]
MPVVVLCGLPLVGKSALAQRIALAAPSVLGPVSILSDRGLSDYTEPQREKTARSRLRAALERAPFRDRLVVVDACNLVSGFRYELWCVSRVPAGEHQKAVPHVTILVRDDTMNTEESELKTSWSTKLPSVEQTVGSTREAVFPQCHEPELSKSGLFMDSNRAFNLSAETTGIPSQQRISDRGDLSNYHPFAAVKPAFEAVEATPECKLEIDEMRKRFEWPDPLNRRWDRPLFTMIIHETRRCYESPDGRSFSDESMWLATLFDWISSDDPRKDFKPAARMSLATRQTRIQSEGSLLERELHKIEDVFIHLLLADNAHSDRDQAVVLHSDAPPLKIPALYSQRLALMTNQNSRQYAISQDIKSYRRAFMRKRQKRRSEMDVIADIREYIESLEAFLSLRGSQHLSIHD